MEVKSIYFVIWVSVVFFYRSSCSIIVLYILILDIIVIKIICGFIIYIMYDGKFLGFFVVYCLMCFCIL